MNNIHMVSCPECGVAHNEEFGHVCRKRSCEMLLWNGETLDPFNPNMDHIHLANIAHSLSMTCRYGRQSKVFYSVATHSTLVADLIRHLGGNFQTIRAGIMHDVAEAYFADMITPIKKLFPEYEEAEEQFKQKVFEKFCIHDYDANLLHRADRAMLEIESAILMPKPILSHGEILEGISNVWKLSSHSLISRDNFNVARARMIGWMASYFREELNGGKVR